MAQVSNMEKQDVRIAKTRQKVLDAGVTVLFTDGWSEVTHLRLAKETGVARAVPHFDEVAQGQVANGISIGLAKGGEFPHQGPPFRSLGGAGVAVQQVGEDPGVFEAAVHPLSIE